MTAVLTDPWAIVDGAYRALLQEAPDDRRWLLVQTLATGASRRPLLASLPIAAGARVLDVGCGFGAASLELAALRPVSVLGLDVDADVLAVAADAAARVVGAGGLAGGSSVGFAVADAYRLPVPTGSVDAVVSRFVFQHLADPAAAAAELRRVLRPGGLACIVDVDDGLSISEPAPSPAYTRLATALRASQSSYGGNRHIGRRLPALLDRAGLAPGPVIVLPQAAYHRPEPGGPERALLLERLRVAREGIVGGGHMTAGDYEADLAALAAEDAGPAFEVEAQLAVIATRP